MGILSHLLLVLVIYISSATCIPNTTFESMKIGIFPFNEAGNNFFYILRPRLDPLNIKIENYSNTTLSFHQIFNSGRQFLSYYILVFIGVTFAVVMPIAGIVIILCRCCGKCGGKLKAMDPRHAKCKRVVYGLILVVLTTGMLFGTVISQFNNHIFHETVVNEDKSVNVFLNTKSNIQTIRRALSEIRGTVNKSQSVKIESHQLQALSNDLDDNIKSFYSRLVTIPEVQDVIDQSKTLKLVLDRGNVTKFKIFINETNNNGSKLNIQLSSLKERIRGRLENCNTVECTEVKAKTEQLQLPVVDQDVVNKIRDTLISLEGDDFLKGLAKIIDAKDNNSVNIKLISEGELKYIKDKINNESFSESMKSILRDGIDKMQNVTKLMEDSMPSIMEDQTAQHETYKSLKQMEAYRYFWFLGSCIVIAVIVLCFYLGLMFGAFGGRPSDDASCCNKGVGARFLIGGVVLTFLFSSVFMAVVIVQMVSTGVVNTEICRYAGLQQEMDAKVLDVYIDAILKNTGALTTSNDIMDSLLNKCATQNFYSSFVKYNQMTIKGFFANHLTNIDDKVVAYILSQFNLTNMLKRDPFQAYSSVDTNKLIESIELLKDNDTFHQYLHQLSNVDREDREDMLALYEIIISQKTNMKLVVQFLNNTENEYIRWKKLGLVLNSKIVSTVKSKTPALVSSVEKNLVGALDGIFNEMFKNVSCKDLRSATAVLLQTVCRDAIDPLNGTWYGIGFFLLVSIPSLVFACLLIGLYRRIQNFYPDKEEPDYDNYIGFYARADSEKLKNITAAKRPAHRGYKPIPMQSMT